MIENEDWRIKFAGLMALSQMAEHVESMQDLLPPTYLVFNLIQHDNPIIRTACFHVLGQFAQDKTSEFIQSVSEASLQAAITGLNDSVGYIDASIEE